MKTKFHKIILTIGLILSFSGINAQIDKMHAIDLVMNNVVQGDQVNFNVLIFPEPIKGSNYKLSDFHTLHFPYDNAWLFFIDMIPMAQWDHDCKYLFVDQVSGEITEIKHRIPPNNYWCNWEFVNYPFPYPETNLITDSVQAVNYNVTPDPHKYAVFLCWNEEEPCRWNNLSHLYCGIKRNYGFSDENIIVLSGDAIYHTDSTYNLDWDENEQDFDGPCTKDNIQDVFNGLSEIMTDEDILFVYVTSHGDKHGQDISSIRLWNYDSLFDYDLATMVEDINCSHKIFGLDACWSGNFVDDLEGDHTVVQTCVGDTISVIIQGDLGFQDMSFWWGTALRGYYPLSKSKPWDNGPKIGEHDSLYTISNIDSTDYNPDSVAFGGNGDGYIQFQEAFNFAHHYASDIRDRNGQNYINNGFRGDLLTLNGIEGRVDTTQSIVGNYLIGRKLTIHSGVTLSDAGVATHHLNLFLNDSTEILVENGATLDIGGYFADFLGCSGHSFINIEGNISQTRMHFTGNPDAEIQINLNNEDKQYSLDRFTFENAKVTGICDSLSFVLSEFNNSTIDFSGNKLVISNTNEFTASNLEFSGEALQISNSNGFNGSILNLSAGNIIIDEANNFTNSTIDISDPSSLASSCEISGNNTFDNSTTTQAKAVITIENYTNFLIDSNDIKYVDNRGIELFYAGWDESGDHKLRKNTIRYAGTASPGADELGIHSYFSNAEIENNRISKNYYGLTGFHGSELKVTGDSTAKDIYETQLIEDNTHSQCIFSYGSFPTAFQHNVLKDTSAGNKPFIRAVDYDEVIPDTNQNRNFRGSLHFHVEKNYWVNDTNPSDRLLPLNLYYWRPIWQPGSGQLKSDDIAETLYYQSINNIEEGNYQAAESGFKQIIAEYPENKYAQASLKGLFGLNPALHDTDYTFMKAYGDSLSMNPGDSLLGKTAEWLSIHCNIRDKQYQHAINSLDSIINNPGTLADSVFALIDLIYVFNEANNGSGSKSTLVTKHPEVIPESNMNYIIQRKEWIDLLLKTDDNSSQEGVEEFELNEVLMPGKISSIHPNPSNGNFTIDYVLDKKSYVGLSILSSSGQIMKEIQKGVMEKGEYQELISDLELPVGIYFIKLSLDKTVTDARKLIIVK
jgi:hypothetical protein